jgi:RpiB/LacA/LacB family sugar-phosphate isomerase
MRRVITAQDIPASGELRVPLGTLFTPSAREAAAARGVRIVELPPGEISELAPPERTVALGADHSGFHLKEALKPLFEECGLAVRDVGVHEEKTADYPDIARQVAELVASGAARRGVILDGAGIGSSIAANKVPGIRAALCYDKSSARNSREHNDFQCTYARGSAAHRQPGGGGPAHLAGHSVRRRPARRAPGKDRADRAGVLETWSPTLIPERGPRDRR